MGRLHRRYGFTPTIVTFLALSVFPSIFTLATETVPVIYTVLIVVARVRHTRIIVLPVCAIVSDPSIPADAFESSMVLINARRSVVTRVAVACRGVSIHIAHNLSLHVAVPSMSVISAHTPAVVSEQVTDTSMSTGIRHTRVVRFTIPSPVYASACALRSMLPYTTMSAILTRVYLARNVWFVSLIQREVM